MRHIVRCGTKSQALVQRARVLLEIATGANNREAARRLGLHVSTPRLWRGRWLGAQERLRALEAADSDDRALLCAIEEVLADAPRSGTPPTFTAEQVVQIQALACEDPGAAGRPISHWTHRELADEAVGRGIVPRISPATVGRFLKGGRAEAP